MRACGAAARLERIPDQTTMADLEVGNVGSRSDGGFDRTLDGSRGHKRST
jgi:hypothetical protein